MKPKALKSFKLTIKFDDGSSQILKSEGKILSSDLDMKRDPPEPIFNRFQVYCDNGPYELTFKAVMVPAEAGGVIYTVRVKDPCKHENTRTGAGVYLPKDVVVCKDCGKQGKQKVEWDN